MRELSSSEDCSAFPAGSFWVVQHGAHLTFSTRIWLCLYTAGLGGAADLSQMAAGSAPDCGARSEVMDGSVSWQLLICWCNLVL